MHAPLCFQGAVRQSSDSVPGKDEALKEGNIQRVLLPLWIVMLELIAIDMGSQLLMISNQDRVFDGRKEGSQEVCFQDLARFFAK
jgi:hypothetical protein